MSEALTSESRRSRVARAEDRDPSHVVTQSQESLRRELDEASEELEGRSAEEILRWAVERFGNEFALSVSFGGPEGMVLLDMLSKVVDRTPELAAEREARPTVITMDTGFLFSETVRFREKTMRRYKNLNLQVARPALTVEEQVERYGERMRTCSPDLCCQVRKIEPLERALKDYDAWMTGIRREQTPQRANTRVVTWEERYGGAKIAPLAFMSEEWVHEYVAEHDVPVNPLLERGYKSIGCEPQTRPVAPDEDTRAGRWAGIEKTECGIHWVDGKMVRGNA